jgi:hypothetical protein
MKVKELIDQLQKLDPERNVWIFYDFPCDAFEPWFRECKAEEAACFKDEGVAAMDYVCDAG